LTLPLTLHPTLVPYTTLFRSHGDLRVRSSPHPSLGEESADPLAVQHLPRPGPPAGADQPAGQRQPRGRPVPGAHAVPVLRGAARDRKSTRLNSSHEWISYAVF